MGYNDSIIEKEVVQFLINFQNVILARDYGDYDEQIEDIQEHYENQWNRVTEKYYKSDLWPKPEDIAEEFSNNGIDFLDEFRVLYTELYYRHAHAKVGSNKSRDTSAALQEMMYCRFKSWDNYRKFGKCGENRKKEENSGKEGERGGNEKRAKRGQKGSKRGQKGVKSGSKGGQKGVKKGLVKLIKYNIFKIQTV